MSLVEPNRHDELFATVMHQSIMYFACRAIVQESAVKKDLVAGSMQRFRSQLDTIAINI